MIGKESPFSIVWLAERVDQEGSERVREQLGPYVLVGEHTGEDDGSWTFATSTMVNPKVAKALGVGFDFDRGVVHALEKRTSTFAKVILVGRATSNDVRVDHYSVSKLHARIRLVEGGFTLEDAGSRNGTWLKGAQIDSVVTVKPGDRVGFGTCDFTVHESAAFVDVLRRIGPG